MRRFNRPLIATIGLLYIFSLGFANTVKDGGHHDAAHSPKHSVLLPDWLGSGFSVSSTDHFLVAHDCGPDQARQLADLLEKAFTQFTTFFTQSGFELQPPDARLSWISFSDKDHFDRYVRRAERTNVSRLNGYYSARTNRVVIVESSLPERLDYSPGLNESIAHEVPQDIAAIAGGSDPNQFVKVAHELAHQLAFNTGLQKRGVMYPLWASEGLAMQLETTLTSHRGENAGRSDRLLDMHRHNRLIPLEQFVSITRMPADRDRCEDLYAQAWGFFDFLVTQHPETLKNYLEHLYNLDTGFRRVSVLDNEFAAHFGSVEKLNRQWLHYICAQ